MTTMKDAFARTRAKNAGSMAFDFAFGAASAASFLLFAAAGKRGVCRAFFCPFLPEIEAGARMDYFPIREL